MNNDYRKAVENYSFGAVTPDYDYALFPKDTYLSFFHASEVEVRKPQWDYAQTIMKKNEAGLRDFGMGFYACLNDEYPLKLASDKANLVLNSYTANLEGLRYIEFDLDLEWLLSIGFHRRDLGSRSWCHMLRDRCRNWLSGCDIAVGIISNDKTYSAIEGFLDNTMTDEAAIAMINAADYGKQYFFKSVSACERLSDGFKYSAEYLPDQIEQYRERFIAEKAEYAGRADRLRMDITRRGGGEFFEDIVLGGVFNGRVRF